MQIMVFIKTLGITWGGLLRVAAVIIAMLLVPVGASAHGTGDRLAAGNCTEAGQDASSAVFEFERTTPASGCCLRCHLASIPPTGAGPNQSLDDDQSVTVAPVVLTLAAQNLVTHSTPAVRIPIAVPPRFILFGNFRS